jgi:membrane protease YdiL (CAAX protease family)
MFDSLDINSLPLSQSMMIFISDPMVLLCIAIDLFILLHLRRNWPDWSDLARRLTSRPWTTREAETMILAVIMFILAGRAATSALYSLGYIPEHQAQTWMVLAQTVLFHLPVLVLIFVILIRSNMIRTGFLGYSTPALLSGLRRGTIFCLATMPILGLLALAQSHFFVKVGLPNEPQYVVELISQPGPVWLKVYLVFVSLVTAPIAEEFIFRGIGTTALAGRVGTTWAIVIVSGAFALIHFNLYSYLPLFTIAIAFSTAYVYTGSLLVPVFMHSVFNALNLAALYVSTQMQ